MLCIFLVGLRIVLMIRKLKISHSVQCKLVQETPEIPRTTHNTSYSYTVPGSASVL